MIAVIASRFTGVVGCDGGEKGGRGQSERRVGMELAREGGMEK